MKSKLLDTIIKVYALGVGTVFLFLFIELIFNGKSYIMEQNLIVLYIEMIFTMMFLPVLAVSFAFSFKKLITEGG